MLDISPILLIGSALVFLLVLARLNSCLYKPLFKHMDDRDTQIKTERNAFHAYHLPRLIQEVSRWVQPPQSNQHNSFGSS